jgi:glutathione S-transferase
MKLYLINGSPNGRKVLAVINHLKLDVELVWLNLFEGENQTPEYLKLNPTGLTPTLVDGDFVLYESNAIISYLAEVSGNEEFYPNDIKTRSKIKQWLCWELAQYNKILGILSFELVAKPNFGFGETNVPVVEHFSAMFDRYATVLEEHFRENDFMVGSNWTAADYAIGHIEMFVEGVNTIQWSKYPNLLSFYKRFRENENWKMTAANPEQIGQAPL